MATEFVRDKFLQGMARVIRERENTVLLGSKLGGRGFKRLFFVACGAPNMVMFIIEYWVKRHTRGLDVRRYFPAEFIHQDPAALDGETLVVIGSHSGTTRETVDAARFLRDKPCTTVCITQRPDSPLARLVQHPIVYGDCEHGYYPFFFLILALVSAFMKGSEGWVLHEEVIASLDALPDAIADAIESVEERAREDALFLKDDRVLYVVGAGPMYSTAHVFGVCVLAESQWMHVAPVVAAEFFHGAFEAVDRSVPVVVLVGEDPSRPEAERVLNFCKRFTERLIVYDSRDFEMRGVHPKVRAIVAPHVVEAALYRLAEHLAALHGQPLSTRRYMGKVEY